MTARVTWRCRCSAARERSGAGADVAAPRKRDTVTCVLDPRYPRGVVGRAHGARGHEPLTAQRR